MNFTYVLGFVMLRDVVKVFAVSSSSFARKTTGRNRAQKSLGGMTRPKDEMGSQIVSSQSDIPHPILVYLSRSEQQLPSSSSMPSSSDSSGAWISSHFRIQVRSADECLAPGRRQYRETRWTSDGPLSSPEMNLKAGLLPLFFIQLLLSHMFLSFTVRTPPPLNQPLSFLHRTSAVAMQSHRRLAFARRTWEWYTYDAHLQRTLACGVKGQNHWFSREKRKVAFPR